MRFLAALGAAAVVSGSLLAPAAAVAADDDYVDAPCDVRVSDPNARPGQTVTAVGRMPASARGGEARWTFRFAGQTRRATGDIVEVRFTVPQSASGREVLRASAASAAEDCGQDVNVNTGGQGVAGPGSTTLPNTGGPDERWLLLGIGLVVAGSGTVAASKRRPRTLALAGMHRG